MLEAGDPVEVLKLKVPTHFCQRTAILGLLSSLSPPCPQPWLLACTCDELQALSAAQEEAWSQILGRRPLNSCVGCA